MITYGITVVLSPPPGIQNATLFTLQLTNSSGKNITTSAITVTAVSIDGKTVPVSVVSDPKNTFFFVPVVNTDIYTLSTKGLSAGAHTLTISVAGDPDSHTINFTVAS